MEIFDVIIIGLGPAGVAAAVYSGRKKLKTLVIGKEIGGQSVVSREIHNWIGITKLPGAEMAMKLYDHLETVEDSVRVIEGEIVVSLESVAQNNEKIFLAKAGGKGYYGRTVLVASGSSRRRLNIEGEKEFSGNGVYYCSICDAPLMKGTDVVVIGGGNAGLEAVIDLIPYARKIYLMEVTDHLRADNTTREKALSSQKVRCLLEAKAKKITGNKSVMGLEYENLSSGKLEFLDIGGVFVEIGSVPNSNFLKGSAEMNPMGEIIVDPLSGKSSLEGIWAAGDVTSLPYNQNNIAMGDAIRAILNIYDYLIAKG
jgi:alkyl hydroperoxide reductase subunit F